MDVMVSSVLSSDGAARHRDSVPLVSGDDGRTLVWLDGEHDIATASALADTLTRAISADDAGVIVDLSGVTFISAATLGVLISGRNLLRQRSRSLTLQSPSRCARRVLDACGLTGLIESGPLQASVTGSLALVSPTSLELG